MSKIRENTVAQELEIALGYIYQKRRRLNRLKKRKANKADIAQLEAALYIEVEFFNWNYSKVS